jgi:hypothetical protein
VFDPPSPQFTLFSFLHVLFFLTTFYIFIWDDAKTSAAKEANSLPAMGLKRII